MRELLLSLSGQDDGGQNANVNMLFAGGYLFCHHFLHGGFNLDVAQGEVACHLIAHQHANFTHQFAKNVGRSVFFDA